MTGGSPDRPIVVTGAASGMGRATAMLLAKRGHPIVLIDVNLSGLAEIGDEIAEAGGTGLAVQADVRSREQLEDAFERGQSAFGFCWGLAAAAGVIEGASLVDLTDDHLGRLIGINLIGLATCTQLAARQMRRGHRGGRIVNWASDAAIGASPGFSIYGATKAAVLSLTKSAALELAADGITVNAIVPGIVDTPIADYLTLAQKERLGKLVPAGRWGSADELAAVAANFFTDDMSYVSGATLLADGGATSAMGRHLVDRLMGE